MPEKRGRMGNLGFWAGNGPGTPSGYTCDAIGNWAFFMRETEFEIQLVGRKNPRTGGENA